MLHNKKSATRGQRFSNDAKENPDSRKDIRFQQSFYQQPPFGYCSFHFQHSLQHSIAKRCMDPGKNESTFPIFFVPLKR
jgi:hypothetical protein